MERKTNLTQKHSTMTVVGLLLLLIPVFELVVWFSLYSVNLSDTEFQSYQKTQTALSYFPQFLGNPLLRLASLIVPTIASLVFVIRGRKTATKVLKVLSNVVLILASLILLLMLLAIGSNLTSEERYTIQTLPNGGSIKEISFDQLTTPDGLPMLWYQYETDIQFDDSVAIRKELIDVWKYIHPKVDSGRFHQVGITVHENATGFIFKDSRAENCSFSQNRDGVWFLTIRNSVWLWNH